ncbi:MAG TPA: hypothetical protein VJ989_11670, partial [Solirubrobacterales bacterium]|nr:hypothetical protein [Solirubrobacterales bacterium]
QTTPLRSPAKGRAFSWRYMLTLSGAAVLKVSVALQLVEKHPQTRIPKRNDAPAAADSLSP